MSTTTQRDASILDQLLATEADIQRILRMPDIRIQHPKACACLDTILNAISLAYIKFNEGDDAE